MLGFGKKKNDQMDPVIAAQIQEKQEVSKAFAKGVTALRDFIAPSSLEFNSNHFRIGTRFARTYTSMVIRGRFTPAGCRA